MELSEIKEILKAFDESKSVYFRLEQDGVCLKLKKGGASRREKADRENNAKTENAANPPKTEEGDTQPNEEEIEGALIKAPLVGVFYAAPSPEEPAFVQVGDHVRKGQTLCLIEAMKMMNEIKAPGDGVIKKIYVKNQDVVGFDDPLFEMEEA